MNDLTGKQPGDVLTAAELAEVFSGKRFDSDGVVYSGQTHAARSHLTIRDIKPDFPWRHAGQFPEIATGNKLIAGRVKFIVDWHSGDPVAVLQTPWGAF